MACNLLPYNINTDLARHKFAELEKLFLMYISKMSTCVASKEISKHPINMNNVRKLVDSLSNIYEINYQRPRVIQHPPTPTPLHTIPYNEIAVDWQDQMEQRLQLINKKFHPNYQNLSYNFVNHHEPGAKPNICNPILDYMCQPIHFIVDYVDKNSDTYQQYAQHYEIILLRKADGTKFLELRHLPNLTDNCQCENLTYDFYPTYDLFEFLGPNFEVFLSYKESRPLRLQNNCSFSNQRSFNTNVCHQYPSTIKSNQYLKQSVFNGAPYNRPVNRIKHHDSTEDLDYECSFQIEPYIWEYVQKISLILNSFHDQRRDLNKFKQMVELFEPVFIRFERMFPAIVIPRSQCESAYNGEDLYLKYSGSPHESINYWIGLIETKNPTKTQCMNEALRETRGRARRFLFIYSIRHYGCDHDDWDCAKVSMRDQFRPDEYLISPGYMQFEDQDFLEFFLETKDFWYFSKFEGRKEKIEKFVRALNNQTFDMLLEELNWRMMWEDFYESFMATVLKQINNRYQNKKLERELDAFRALQSSNNKKPTTGIKAEPEIIPEP